MTEKEQVEALKNLCIFLASQQSKQKDSIGKTIRHLAKKEYQEARDQLVLKTPIVQGIQSQLNLKTIGEQSYDSNQCSIAVKLLLGNLL